MVKNIVQILIFLSLLSGLCYLFFVNRNKITPVALPAVTDIHISPQMIMDAANNFRSRTNLPVLNIRDDLCSLGNDILATLKTQWRTGVFDTSTKNFYKSHPGYSNLAMQAANIDLSTPEKINSWLGSEPVRKEITSADYNSVCVDTDGSYTVQILGTLNPPKEHLPIPTTSPAAAPDSGPWGVSKQVDEHTWTIKVGQDSVMATPAEIFDALNNYRRRYGSQALTWDQKLADFAQSRAEYLNRIKNTDDHKGFLDYLNNQDGFNKLGFTSLGENMFYGYRLSGVHIIEWVYAGDEPHNSNQLDNKWNYAGIGVSGLGNCIIFGTGRH